MFNKAVDYVNYELVPGDIVEFGVFTGRTLAAFAYFNTHSQYEVPFDRIVRGFDSFAGLPDSSDIHPRWGNDNCTVNHLSSTPTIRHGESVSVHGVRALFSQLNLPAPDICEGEFDETLKTVVPARCSEVAIVHIDCDIYESAITALAGIEPALQDGAIVLFDDWFHYKANPSKGEQKALAEFLDLHPQWQAMDYGAYATFCKTFIMSRR
jgi:hypothetical protein